MKRIISIVTAVCASIALFTACSKDNSITELDGLHVSSSYVSIAEKGATATITLHAAGDWKLEKVTTKKNKADPVADPALSDLLAYPHQKHSSR